MVYVSIEDFYTKASSCRILNRQEERACAERMKAGDGNARQQLMQSYLPMTAQHVKRMKPDLQTLSHALYCVDALEKAVDSFDFFQDSETFTHRLSWYLRNATTKYIADH